MDTTPLLMLASLCLFSGQVLSAAPSSTVAEQERLYQLVQRRYHAGVCPYDELLEAERGLLDARAQQGLFTPEQLQQRLDSLDGRYVSYLDGCVEGGVCGKAERNGRLIDLLLWKRGLNRRAGNPVEETSARLRALYEDTLAMRQRLHAAGFAPAEQVEEARRALKDFLETP